MPGIVAGAMLAFTLSLDDFVISFFTAGPQSQTLPLYIFAAVRRGVTPQIHALSTLVMLATVGLVIMMERMTRRQEKKEEPDIPSAQIDTHGISGQPWPMPPNPCKEL